MFGTSMTKVSPLCIGMCSSIGKLHSGLSTCKENMVFYFSAFALLMLDVAGCGSATQECNSMYMHVFGSKLALSFSTQG